MSHGSETGRIRRERFRGGSHVGDRRDGGIGDDKTVSETDDKEESDEFEENLVALVRGTKWASIDLHALRQ